MKNYIGIDLGGTNIAAGLVNENGEIKAKISVPKNTERGCETILNDIKSLCYGICEKAETKFDDVEKIGIGIPGTIDSENGMVMYSCNLPFNRVPVVQILSQSTGKPVNILNDADAAAYGEYIASGDNCKSFICITLGTGVGSGIILNGKIYNGFNGAGGELGHTTLVKNGIECSCGRKGCWEQYASATALINQTKEAIKNNTSSVMAKCKIPDGQTAFIAADKGDKSAKKVISAYIEYVAEGIVNVVNIFQPNKIVIGGGISREGEVLISPIREYVKKYDYNKHLSKTQITSAVLYNDAGIVGAALR